MNKYAIWLSPPHMGGSEMKYVKDAFDTNWISPAGPHITSFEKELGAYLDVPHVVALCSGTAAIHLALLEIGVRSGDEVLCSTFTFAGSCNPIRYVGANPIFIDSERDTWNMDPNILREAIRDRLKLKMRPKAIILVHLYGVPALLDEIMAIATEFEIPVIEDAAEALGSSWENRKLGSFGDFGIFSFNGNKIITTSGGGALVSKSQQAIDHSRFLSTQARDPAPHYEHSELGYNYRLSNVSAAIGRGQLEILDLRVRQRRNIFKTYFDQLGTLPEVTFLTERPGALSNRWLTTILLPSREIREGIRLRLEQAGIESRPLWKPMHLQPVFSDARFYGGSVSEGLFDRGLCLPSGSALTPDDQDRVANLVMAELAHR